MGGVMEAYQEIMKRGYGQVSPSARQDSDKKRLKNEISSLRKSSTPFDKVHEECGVFGIAAPEGKEIPAAHDAYTALFALQHRGQEAAGIAVNKNGVIHCHKDAGLVSAVFNQEILDNMPGSMAIGHVRYSTTGDTRRENAQPISITHVKGNTARLRTTATS